MEYCKHFSHPHYLTFQQLQPGPEIQCSGCKSPATGSIYICFQCSFFLHEQCYQASRSLNHHSHPSHPLTLIPYPTYPSASFICNSCNQTGTGFSFSCSNCDFDLHVHCAYNSQYPNFSLPNENPSFHSQFPSMLTHESYPNVPNHEPLFNNHPHVHGTIAPESAIHGPHTVVHQPPFQNMSNPQNPLPNQTPPPSFNTPMASAPNQLNMQQPSQNIPNLPPQPPQYEVVPSFNAQTRPDTTAKPSNANKPINVSASGENQQKLNGVKLTMLDNQAHLQRLHEMEMQMSQLTAQTMVNASQSMANALQSTLKLF